MQKTFIPVVVFLSAGEAGREKFYSVITSSRSHYFCNCHVTSLINKKPKELIVLLATSNRKPTVGCTVPQNWKDLEVRMGNLILPFSSSRIENVSLFC